MKPEELTLGNVILELFGFPDYFLGGSQNWRIWEGGGMREYYVLCGADSFLSSLSSVLFIFLIYSNDLLEIIKQII